MPEALIKICGVTSPADAAVCVKEGADMIGLIFAESPRKIDAKRAAQIVGTFPDAHFVGVFMDQSLEEVRRIAGEVGLETVQLHGKEPPAFALALRDDGRKVIKAMTPDRPEPDYPADFFLLDVPKEQERADEAYCEAARKLGQRLFLSGRLTPENVGRWLLELRPAGVDVCRGTEASPGKKDPNRLKAFVRAVRRQGETRVSKR
ncbi:MAG: phosphoribosylanthranilate isomerase [Planctomycetota bacterium]|jgi:phosphoribosylanthranilate isomerase